MIKLRLQDFLAVSIFHHAKIAILSAPIMKLYFKEAKTMAIGTEIKILKEAWEYHPVYGNFTRRCYEMVYVNGKMDHCRKAWYEYKGLD